MTGLGPRRNLPERLDEDDLDPRLLARSATALSWINRWLGGDLPLRAHLRQVRGRGSLRLLDVGAGRADVPLRLQRWARKGGARWRVVALDRHPGFAELARRNGQDAEDFDVVRGDGLRLPFADGSFDVVVATLTLHHFDDDGALLLLREMARVATGHVLVNDLERCRPHYLAARLLAGTVWRRDPVTRHDGPRSVLRAFTKGELSELGRRSGLSSVTVHRHPPFRLVLKGGAANAAMGGTGPRSAPHRAGRREA